MKIFNITGTESPLVGATKFVNKIPHAVMVAAKRDMNGGDVFYDRLMSLEARGEEIDVTEQSLVTGIGYAVQALGMTAAQAYALIGFVEKEDECRVYDLSRIAGDIPKWVADNVTPTDAVFGLNFSGTTCYVFGTLPAPEIK